jgi:hypothetical protein
MSTPKINFFIQAGHRGIFTGHCGQPGILRTIVRVSSPGSARARDSAGREEMLPGKIRGAGNELPGVSRSQRPDPEQLFPMPAGKVPIFKRRCCCSEFELHTQQPDGIITRTILRLNPDPAAGDPDAPIIPNISRWRTQARPRKANQLFRWGFAICCYWDLFGFYGNFCWCNVFHAIFSTFHKFLQLF